MNPEHRKIIQKAGKHYGYPRCCIENFIAMKTLPTSERKELMKWGGYTGFIPCASCSDHVRSLVEDGIPLVDALRSLLWNRKCPKEFPEDEWNKNDGLQNP